MIRYKYKTDRDRTWIASEIWSFPEGLNPESEEELNRRKARKPFTPELKEARRQHMKQLYESVGSYALIGKLYKIDRSEVRKIINT